MGNTTPKARPARHAPAGGRLTVAQVAAELGVTETCVLAWIANGSLRAVNVAGAADAKRPSWRIARADLDAFLAARTNTPVPAVPRRQRRQKSADVIEFYR